MNKVTDVGRALIKAAEQSENITYMQIDGHGDVVIHMGGAGR